MKKVIIFILLVSSSSFAQEENTKTKFATFGFDLGVNRSNLAFGSDQDGSGTITNGLGYRLGIISNFRLSPKFSLSPKAELSFNASRISQSTVEYKVNPVNLEGMLHVKYKLFKSKFTPYVIVGPNIRIPLSTPNPDYIPVKNDIAIDAGIGLDIPLRNIKLSPELRYSFGLVSNVSSPTFGPLNYHNLSIVLAFSGK
jgi:hypothetical protein